MPCRPDSEQAAVLHKPQKPQQQQKTPKHSNNTGAAPPAAAGTRRSRRDSSCSSGAGIDADARRPALAAASRLSPRLFRVLNEANAPALAVDAAGRVTFWNLKLAQLSGLLAGDVLGRPVAELVAPARAAEVTRGLEQALADADATVRDVEIELNTPELGHNVKLLVNLTVDADDSDAVSVVAVGQDVTVWTLQGSQYARVAQQANAPIVELDRDGHVVLWNPKAEALTGYSIDQVTGTPLVDLVHEDFRVLVGELLARVASTNTSVSEFELPLVTASGARVELLLSLTPQVSVDGAGATVNRIVAIGQDVTARNASEMEYSKLKIEEITGYHKSTVLGLELVETFINPENRSEVSKLLNQALIGIDVEEMELPMTTAAGRSLLLLVNASSKKDMHGNIRGVIGVGQDYTAKKHMEAAKVNFLASFSHELRTPLNGVLGMLELLRDQQLDKTPERYVHIAYISGSLLLNLINDILDLSKIEAGHMEISADPFQMEDLLEYSVEIFKFKAREKHIKLTLECSPKVPQRVIGDVSRLRQVLLNLLSNAIKFTNEGSITVRCNMVPSPDLPKHCVKLLFQVIDTGVGMDDEEKSRLFSLFTKLERTRKNNPTGSGLGLAICKQLVELMDGDIDVDSELGEGSEFFFTVVVRRLEDEEDDIIQKFPAVLAADASAAPSLAASTARHNASMSELVPKHARILVVEDNEFNWEVVKSFFMEDNHLLQWETNGLDAYQMYQEHHDSYDIVLMDCEMPIMNGYDSTRNIRNFEKQHKLARIPIIGVTAYAMSGDRKKCLDAGMDEFIVKPISKTELRKAIRKWMRVRFLVSSTMVVNKAARAYSSTMAPEDVVIPTGDPIDYSLGVEQCGANESLFVSLLEKYAGLSEEFMRRIEEAYSNNDFVVLRRESHSLKGSSAYVAAMRVSKAAFRVQLATEHVMEETATTENHTSLKDAFLLLKKEHRALRGYLRRNFSFRTNAGSGNQDTKKKSGSNGGGGDNACIVM
ncbi:putative hybrid signal transduction histidine kinase [Phytophthora cinnamomi]|nr:putative hybrid signal transduction histidine kinase [Phytophthora cinnamomi]